MALSAAGWCRVCRAHSAVAGALSLGVLWVGLLCGRKDPQVDPLDGLELLRPAIVPRRLGRCGPDAPSMGIGQTIGAVVSRPIPWGDTVGAFLLVGGNPADQGAADTLGTQCCAVPSP